MSLGLTVLLGILISGCSGIADKSVSADSAVDTSTPLPLKAGSHWSFKIHQSSNLEMMFPGVDLKEAFLRLDFNVREITPDNQAVVLVKVATVKTSLSTMGQEYSFDSENPGQSPDNTKSKPANQQKFTDTFKNLKGSGYQAQVDLKTGQVAITQMDPIIQDSATRLPDGDMFGGDQLKMLFSPSALKDYVLGGIEGLNWREKLSSDQPAGHDQAFIVVPYAGKAAVNREYQFKEVQKDKQKTALYTTTIRLAPPADTPPAPPASEQSSSPSAAAVPAHASTFIISDIAGVGELSYSLTGKHLVIRRETIRVVLDPKPAEGARKSSAKKVAMNYQIKTDMEYLTGKPDKENTK